ncbi:hypothetical protein K435DRAFT_755403 [Dendrothele bispora CBS 962.96]|uniref:DUF6534 domain-containing protein n=1 Tax=Dendrothele bispora (strain CBS 962.96) TaxID=1314807 RepID=A0A4S8M1P1_DENBC|nr:hypothetical protein K435DRAFT_755403 [Dendrothele bispora CBS 962.96]
MATITELILGPYFVGWLFNVFLLGLLCVQCYIYRVNYRSDPLWIRIYVVILLLSNALNTAFLAVWLYNVVIVNFGNMDAVFYADWVFATGAAMTGLIVAQVQLFFAWRVQVLTDSYFMALLAAVPSVVGCFAALVSAVYVRKYPHIQDFGHIKVWIVTWLVSETASDLVITTVLVSYLRRNKQGFRSADQVIDRVIRLTVQTGLATSVIAILDVVLYLVFPTNAIHLLFNLPLNKIYSIMLLSNLNSRQGWAFGNSRADSSCPENSTLGIKINSLNLIEYEPSGHGHGAVAVQVEAHEMSDYTPQDKYGETLPLPSPTYQARMRFSSPIFKWK